MSDYRPALGFIGIGLMGRPMSLRLLDKGYRLSVRDLVPEKLAAVVAAGAAEAASPAEVARSSDVVMVCVMGSGLVEDIVLGEGGVVEASGPEKVLVDFSTTAVEETRRTAARLAAESGMGWVDAPVSGGPPAAEAGTLTVMAGGAEADVATVAPIVAELAGRVTHMGPVGAGQVTKMINQILVLTNFCVLAEALKLAENAGIDAAKVPECLAGGYAQSAMLTHHYPRMLARQFEPPAGRVKQVLKDLDMVHDLAKATGTPAPMSALAASLYRMLVARGDEDLDAVAVLKLYEGGGD